VSVRGLIETMPLVDAESFEKELNQVRASAAGPGPGIFGPQSVTWQINRESAIFLGAGRALLLQLAHPWVAAAIEQHSDAFANPISRFHRTFSIVFAIVFGSLDQSLDAARRLHQRHAKIKGRLSTAAGPFPAGSFYYANSISALRWVYATLVESALLAYELVLPPLTVAQRERYYSESRLFAALFGIPNQHLPGNWTGFSAYTEAMVHSDILTVTEQARIMGRRLLTGGDTWLPVPNSYQALTSELLPRRIRDAFVLRYGGMERGAAQRAIARTRCIYSFLPTQLRHVGPYQEAKQRLEGKISPHIATRLSNRFWIGQFELPKMALRK